MFYKIQPEQIQLHNFTSPSGDLKFDIGNNYVYANLSRALTGNFAITGGLTVNGYKIPTISASNLISGDNNFIWGGVSNVNLGKQNVILNGTQNTINGTGNVAVNGHLSSFGVDSLENTLLAGRSAIFNSGTFGASILKDFSSYSIQDNGSNTLTIAFENGTVFENGSITLNDCDFIQSVASQGVFSGDCFFFGQLEKNGETVATTGDLSILSAKSVLLTGAQTISGEKNFASRPKWAGEGLLVLSDISGGATLPPSVLYTTGSQDIVGLKNFTVRPTLSGVGFATISDIGTVSLSGAVLQYGNQTISGTKTFMSGIIASGGMFSPYGVTGSNLVYNTGAQTISGDKNFASRPKWAGVDLVVMSDVTGGAVIPPNIVYTTGSQDVTSLKNFTVRPTLSGVGFATMSDFGVANLSGAVVLTGNQTISGTKTFMSGIIASGGMFSPYGVTGSNLVYNTGEQTISGTKSFLNTPNVSGVNILTVGQAVANLNGVSGIFMISQTGYDALGAGANSQILYMITGLI